MNEPPLLRWPAQCTQPITLHSRHTLIPADHVSGLEHLTMVENNLKNICKGTNRRYYGVCSNLFPVCSAVLADRQLQVLTSPAAVARISPGGTSRGLVTQAQLTRIHRY